MNMGTVHLTPPPLSTQSMADLLCTVVVLCHGVSAHNRPFWAYLCIKPSMAKLFKDACNSGAFNLEDYGTIIEYGEGDTVPPHVQRRMERYYGVNHCYESTLFEYTRELQEQNLVAH